MNYLDVPWKNEYRLLGIPKTLRPYSSKPVWHILEETAGKFKKNGIVQYDYKMTYPELKENVERLAAAFFRYGLKKGERVVTILPTSIQFILADYAISRAGLVQVPCSELEPAETLAHKIEESAPRLMICLAKHVKKIRGLLKKSSIKYLVLTKLDDYGSRTVDLAESEDEYYVDGVMETVWMTSLIKKTPPSPPDIEYNVDEDIETLLFTGGTTGLPKGCMLTHGNINANSVQTQYALGQIGLVARGGLSVLLGLPFFHSYGHVIMHAMTLFGFNQLLVPEPRDTAAMVKMIREYYPVIQFGVPTQFMELSKKELKGISMLGISGSAPLPTQTQQEYEEKSGGGIMEGYGLSEMSPTSHLNTSLLLRLLGGRINLRIVNALLGFPPNRFLLNRVIRLLGPRNFGWLFTRVLGLQFRMTRKKKPGKRKKEKRGTIGVPFPDTEVKLIDVETGRELSWEEVIAGGKGEMLLRGPQRMLGYWPDAGKGLDDEGFVHTSDVVRVDENGYFYIVDRTKDMIIVSGFKVYSRELDDILMGHEKVEVAAVVGIPDPAREGSERVAVFIQPLEKYRNDISSDEIVEFLREKVAKYAVPRHVFLIDEMPLTEVQKVNKKLLRERAAAEAGAVLDN